MKWSVVVATFVLSAAGAYQAKAQEPAQFECLFTKESEVIGQCQLPRDSGWQCTARFADSAHGVCTILGDAIACMFYDPSIYAESGDGPSSDEFADFALPPGVQAAGTTGVSGTGIIVHYRLENASHSPTGELWTARCGKT
ncbi:MAG: hypothetical protein KDJ77_18615 [Rhodobiaceae bacterium]|nr:hypothetical protein [Rhodobiaceae bacterium]